MRGKRKRFQASFKVKVALAALKGDRATSDLTSAFGVHSTQISLWKKQLLDGVADVIADGRSRDRVDHESREGMPWGSSRYFASQSDFDFAQRWMAVGPLASHKIPQMLTTTTSTSRCFRFRVCRGSNNDSKCDPIAPTSAHWLAI